MTASNSEQERLRVVVDWFSSQETRAIPKELEEPLRRYLTSLPASVRKRVVPTGKCKPSKAKVVKPSKAKVAEDPLNPFERGALEYLRAKQDERGGTRMEDSRILQVVNALASVHDVKLTEEEFWKMLPDEARSQIVLFTTDNNDSRCSISAPTPGEAGLPLQCLLNLYRKVEVSKRLHILAARILKVLIHYQYKLLSASGIDNDARRTQMLDRTGFTVEGTKHLRSRATGWLRFMSVFGVGALAMANAQADDEFEKNVDLAFLKDCHGFLVDRCPAIWEHMSDMNRTVGNLFLQLNSKYTRNGVSLTVGTEVLSNCLRKAFAQTATETPLDDSERNTRTGRHTTSPLATLADLAVAAAERNKGDAQVQRQLRVRNESPTAGQMLDPTLCDLPQSFDDTIHDVPSQFGGSLFAPSAIAAAARSSRQSGQQTIQPSFSPLNPYTGLDVTGAQDSGFTNAELFTQASHGNTSSPMQMNQQISYGQNTQAQWRPYTEQIWAPQTANSGLSYTGSQAHNEDTLVPRPQSTRTTAFEKTPIPVQDRTDEIGTDIWDDFILDDFAGSLYHFQ